MLNLDKNLNNRFQVNSNPGLLADSASTDLYPAKRSLDRGGAISVGDGGGGASNESASTDDHWLPCAGAAVAPAENNSKNTLEENIVFER